ncbi:hypothetical protein CCR75_007804 [Bremia lactucae]|uniref:Ubiquitin-like domain-containing protein n=1 Tax=Bremia lactucae TaxID=4779 RepID=A0A976IL68_BRELC|nr:hypothetical protein CCR75_007804 [Bremia lactucae]
MADDAPVASSPLSFLQTPPDSPQDNLSLSENSFSEAVLHLRLKMIDERVYDVEAALSLSVADFRAKVALATSVPPPRQRLIYRGKLLKDGAMLAAYRLQDGHTVHLVARPQATVAVTSTTQTDSRPYDVNGPAWNLASLRSALQRTSTVSAATQPLPMLREIIGDLAESSQETVEGVGGLSSPTVDLEPLTQGILTMRTVMSTAAVEQPVQREQQQDERVGENLQAEVEPENPTIIQRGPRRFFVGQWLDIQDTVNQWLESTVMNVADGKILVHYHGWPTRWDEWIDADSDRIAAFRTRTLHVQNSRQMSPIPSTRVPSAPRVGDNDVRQLVMDVRNLMHDMMPHIDRLAALCEADYNYHRQSGAGVDNTETGLVSEATSLGTRESEVSEVAHLVAPLFDRFGRLLMDSAGCLDPLLRPELRDSSERQRERRTTLSSRNSEGLTPRQAASVSAAMEAQDSALSIRDLIATSPNTVSESGYSRRNIDVHIHAIVAPASLSAFTSLTRGNTETRNHERAANRHVETPSTPPVGRSFASFDESQMSEEDGDQSRVPLLGAFRHDSQSETSQEQAVNQEMVTFISENFFGTLFGHEEDENGRNLELNALEGLQAGRLAYRPPSPSGQMHANATSTRDIPEAAAAEGQSHATEESLSNRNDDDNEQTTSSSEESSTPTTLTFPTFFEIVRRTLSGVRHLAQNEESNNLPVEASSRVEMESDFALRSELLLPSSSSSPLSTPPVSPIVRSSIGSHMSNLSNSIINEELDLDEVD